MRKWRGPNLSLAYEVVDTQPVGAPINSSLPRLFAAPHDFGPVCGAQPSPDASFTHNTLPV